MSSFRCSFLCVQFLFLSILVSSQFALFDSGAAKVRILRSLFQSYPYSYGCGIPQCQPYGQYRPDPFALGPSPHLHFPQSQPGYSSPYFYRPYNGQYGQSYPSSYSPYSQINSQNYQQNYPQSYGQSLYYQHPGASYYGFPMYDLGSNLNPYPLPSSSLISKFRSKDNLPKYMGRGIVNTLSGGIADLSCNFNDPTYQIVSNAAWVKVLGPYNYHEPIPPFDCDHPECSLFYINGANDLRYRVLTTGPTSTLRIYEIQPADHGIYRCTVTGLLSDGTTHTLYQVIEFVH